ncbi:MAG: RNase adapter RapZ [Vibrionaceae bacterium]
MQLTIISGRSGSGKSVALHVLEDLDHYCVDNLPVNLLTQFIAGLDPTIKKVAVSIDIRNLPDHPEQFEQLLDGLDKNINVRLFFLDASDAVLIKRFSETRRRHPLSRGNLTLAQAIEKEQILLEPLKERADKIINTSTFSVHHLANAVRTLVLGHCNNELVMIFESFGYKYGLPADADYVFDARFLPNPHWDATLRPLTGLDEPVRAFFAKEKDVERFIKQLSDFFNNWLPQLQSNNRSYLTIAIGCTGGQHRSVYIAQCLGEYFRSKGLSVQIRHRRLELKDELPIL